MLVSGKMIKKLTPFPTDVLTSSENVCLVQLLMYFKQLQIPLVSNEKATDIRHCNKMTTSIMYY